MTYKRKGVGPRALGSPLKNTKNPPIKGGMLKEAAVTANLPKEQPSLGDAVRYSVATGTTAGSWRDKQHPSMIRHSPKPVTGNPPMVGGPKMATKGFQLAKKAVSKLSKYAPRTASAAGEVFEGLEDYDKIKRKLK